MVLDQRWPQHSLRPKPGGDAFEDERQGLANPHGIGNQRFATLFECLDVKRFEFEVASRCQQLHFRQLFGK